MKKVLIQDIAKEMGLSRNTVAKALKNDEIVLESTRRKVIRKAYEMGYQKLEPGMLEGLSEEEQGNVTDNKKYAILMASYTEDDFWNGVVWGITDRIKKENGSCLLVFVSPEDEKSMTVPNTLLTEKVEGIMCLTVFQQEYEQKICSLGIPVVFMDAPVLHIPYRHEHDRIILEGAQSMYAITSDLLRRGCVQLGFIGDITYCESIYDRFRGFELAMNDAGKEIDKKICLIERNEEHYYSREIIEAKLDSMEKLPDAIVCANDYIAILVIQYCKKKEIKVPEQVAVTGFDNKKECMIIEPHITTVNTTNRRIGMRIAEQMIWRIQNPAMHKEIIRISTEPYFRESSAR